MYGSGRAAERPAPEPLGGAVADGGGAQYRPVMAGTGSDEHRERARRAQQLSVQAHAHVGGERAAAERSEQLMAEATDPELADRHRRAAAVHRDALQQHEEAAEFQQLHADHERRAAERADAIDSAGREPDEESR